MRDARSLYCTFFIIWAHINPQLVDLRIKFCEERGSQKHLLK